MKTEESPRFNCGWNIPQVTRTAVLEAVKTWKPKTDIEKRDKKICELAFRENMNAMQIERLQDPLIVRYNKKGESLGKPLGAKGILNAIYNNFPQLRRKRGYSVTTQGAEKRAALTPSNLEKITTSKPKICAVCGSVENLRRHHIVPIDHGGTNDTVNLIYLCTDCHNELHAKIYKTWGESGQSKREMAPKGAEPIQEMAVVIRSRTKTKPQPIATKATKSNRRLEWLDAIHRARVQA